jgi:hypothetical protein
MMILSEEIKDWMFMRTQKKKIIILITVDVARGLGSDYSAFIVFDITDFPYKVAAKYRNNEIKPMLFPSVLFIEVAKAYNECLGY